MRRKTVLLLILAAGWLVSAAAVAAPRAVAGKVNVIYRDIKIMVDGKQVASPVEPFILEKSNITMVPLRAISEALGFPVAWDAATGTISINRGGAGQGAGEAPTAPAGAGAAAAGGSQAQPVPVAAPQEPYVLLAKLPVLRNVGPFYQQNGYLKVAGRGFAEGVAVDLKKDQQAETILDLAGKYKTASFYLGVEDETRNSSGAYVLNVYGDGAQLYASHLVKPAEYPFLVEINVANVKRFKLQVQWQPGSGIGEYNNVTAALTDVRFYL